MTVGRTTGDPGIRGISGQALDRSGAGHHPVYVPREILHQAHLTDIKEGVHDGSDQVLGGDRVGGGFPGIGGGLADDLAQAKATSGENINYVIPAWRVRQAIERHHHDQAGGGPADYTRIQARVPEPLASTDHEAGHEAVFIITVAFSLIVVYLMVTGAATNIAIVDGLTIPLCASVTKISPKNTRAR